MSSLLLHGAMPHKFWPSPYGPRPPQIVGCPICLFLNCSGKTGGMAAVSCVSKPGLVPPTPMLMRLLEYANAASFTMEDPSNDVTLPTICFDGCTQLPSMTGNGSSPQ